MIPIKPKKCKGLWKDIPNYLGFYQASSLGRIRSIDRTVKVGNKNRNYKGKIIMQSLDKDGYCLICLHKEGKRKTLRSHRIIAETFISNPKEKGLINHKNGIRSDNRISNLEWANYHENNSSYLENPIGIKSSGNKFIARIQKNNERHYLGTHDSIDEAKKAYLNKMQSLKISNKYA